MTFTGGHRYRYRREKAAEDTWGPWGSPCGLLLNVAYLSLWDLLGPDLVYTPRRFDGRGLLCLSTFLGCRVRRYRLHGG